MPSWLAGKTPGQCTLLLSQLPCTVHLLPSQQVWPAASRCLPHVSSDATEWVPPAVTTHYSTYLPGVCGHRSDNFYSSLKDKDSNLVDKRRLSSLLMCEGAGAWCWSFFFLPFTLSASGNLAVLISFKGLCSQGLYHTAEVTARWQQTLNEKVIRAMPVMPFLLTKLSLAKGPLHSINHHHVATVDDIVTKSAEKDGSLNEVRLIYLKTVG